MGVEKVAEEKLSLIQKIRLANSIHSSLVELAFEEEAEKEHTEQVIFEHRRRRDELNSAVRRLLYRS